MAALGDVRDLTDAFTFEGRIFAHATFVSRPDTHAGRQSIEVRWYNGDKIVSVQRAEQTVYKTPYYLVSSTSGTNLGAGKCRVDVLANGKLLASKGFQVTQR